MYDDKLQGGNIKSASCICVNSSGAFNNMKNKIENLSFLYLKKNMTKVNRRQQPSAAFGAKAISRIWCHRKWRMNN